MSESSSVLFSIADDNEFRFARFYIVCEEVPLGTPESPPIVSGVSDMHPSDFPNVEETRNPMQTFGWKKCSHFSPTNIPSAFPHEILKCTYHNITYHQLPPVICGSLFFIRLSNLLQYLLSVHIQMISVCRNIGDITVKACDIAVAGQCPG